MYDPVRYNLWQPLLFCVQNRNGIPEQKLTGSRFAVCDASTMEVIKEFPYIATTTKTEQNGKETLISIADGRSYLPVDEHKGYIGTSKWDLCIRQ